MTLAESVPENLTYPSGAVSYPSTYSVWKQLITEANSTIHIASMYWTLRDKETGTTGSPSAAQVLVRWLLQAMTWSILLHQTPVPLKLQNKLRLEWPS